TVAETGRRGASRGAGGWAGRPSREPGASRAAVARAGRPSRELEAGRGAGRGPEGRGRGAGAGGWGRSGVARAGCGGDVQRRDLAYREVHERVKPSSAVAQSLVDPLSRA